MDTFIETKQSITFRTDDGSKKLSVPSKYIGYIPEWATETLIYKWGTTGNNPIILLPAQPGTTVKPEAKAAGETADAKKSSKGKA